MRAALFSLALVLAAPAVSQVKDGELECAPYRDVPIPKADEPTTEVKDCVSVDLYYGIGVPKNPEAARLCAYQERKNGGGRELGGIEVLMMIYANGIGVKRNIDLALRFACEREWDASEMPGRMARLHALQGNDFDYCQGVVSRPVVAQCGRHEKRIADWQREQRLQKATAAVSGADRVLLDKLRQASRDFIDTRVRHELGEFGYPLQEEALLDEDFLQMIERYEQGKPNRYTAQDLSTRNGKMQAALTRIAQLKIANPGLTVAGVIKTQKAWEAYRDAFAAFAAKHYAGTPDYSVKAWLTAKRVHMLGSIR